MSDKDDAAAVAIIGCLAMLVLVPLFLAIGSVAGGALLYVAWNYGVAAAFHVTVLTFWQSIFIAAGISFVGGCFKATINKASKD